MDLKKVSRLVDEGKSITAIAKALKITRTTLYNRAKKDPKLAEIINSVDRKRGPPPIQIDYEDVRKLAELGCTEYEIARFVGVTKDTFSLRKCKDPKIQEAIDIGSNDIKIALRRAQLKVAMPEGEYHGNVTMLIWLGKQYLKQTDQLKVENDTTCNTTVVKYNYDKLEKDELRELITLTSKAVEGPEDGTGKEKPD